MSDRVKADTVGSGAAGGMAGRGWHGGRRASDRRCETTASLVGDLSVGALKSDDGSTSHELYASAKSTLYTWPRTEVTRYLRTSRAAVVATHRGDAVPARVSAAVRARSDDDRLGASQALWADRPRDQRWALTGTVGRGTSRQTRGPAEDLPCADGSVRRGRGTWRSIRRATASPPRTGRSLPSRRATQRGGAVGIRRRPARRFSSAIFSGRS